MAMDGCVAAVSRECDLLLLDMVLPGRRDWKILRHVRNARLTLPVIILSCKGGERDRVNGLKLGADDYVVKPFSVDELLARVEAVLRGRRRGPRMWMSCRLPAVVWTSRGAKYGLTMAVARSYRAGTGAITIFCLPCGAGD